MNIKSPIFIGGAGRTGTRLLRSIIGKISNVYEVPRETYIFSNESSKNKKVFKSINSIKDLKEQQKALLVYVLLSIFYRKKIAAKKFLILKNNFSHLQRIWNENIISSKQNHDSKIISLYQKIQPLIHSNNIFEIYDFVLECLCQEKDCLRWVEKTPANIFNLTQIKKLYPDARFIAITRNPYAVYSSWKKKNKNIFFTLFNWLKANKEILIQKEKILLIKYEDLVTNPENTIRKVCNYISEPFCEKLLDVEVLNNKDLKGQRGFNLETIFKWQKELNYFEKFFLKLFTKKLAKNLGY
jgi:hypothetical protein